MNRRRSIIFAALGAATLLSAVAATCGNTTTRIENAGNVDNLGIAVTGTGKATAPPDLALITLGVSTLRPTVQEARDAAATALDGIIASLKANGVEDKDIQTQNLSIYPEYDYNGNQQTLRGFRVSNTVTAKIRDIDTTSQVVDDAVTAGGDETTIQGIGFTIENPDELKRQAREAAVADAKTKAATLASAAGVSVGDAISINETSYNAPMPYYAGEMAADRASSGAPIDTPIQPGELDITVDVNVTWSIE